MMPGWATDQHKGKIWVVRATRPDGIDRALGHKYSIAGL